MVAERKSRIESDQSASYAVLDDATVDILSSIQMRFGSCGMSNVLELVVGFGIRTALWLRHSREAIGEEED